MNKKQSLFHIAKRDTLPWYKAALIRGGAIVLALIVCAIVTTLLTGENPIKVYSTILYGAFGTSRKSWVTFHNLAILLGISLAVTPAFKMRFWNIGAEGQVLIGCLATAACMICLGDKVPNGVLILLMILAAIAAGALWGFLPAIFKAKWNTNETLFTLMMNYIATQLAAFFIIVWEVPKGSGKIGIINANSEAGWLPSATSSPFCSWRSSPASCTFISTTASMAMRSPSSARASAPRATRASRSSASSSIRFPPSSTVSLKASFTS